MNEIDKLKAENTRYKKALETLNKFGAMTADTRRIVDCALNPPPPPPVTLEALKAALRKLNEGAGDFHHILFYQDESGGLFNYDHERVFSFSNLQEALDYLEAQ